MVQWNDNKVDQFVQSLETVTAAIDIRGNKGTSAGREFLKIDNGVLTTTTNENEACSKKILAKTINDIMKSGRLDQKSCNKIIDAIDLIKSSPEAIKLKSDSILIFGKIAKIMNRQFNKAVRAITPTPRGVYEGELKNGLYHGKGLLYIGYKEYDGVFKKGVFQKGSLIENNKNQKSVGIFKDGRLYKGTKTEYSNARGISETKIYEGTFDSKGKLHGPGSLIIERKDGLDSSYKGVFEHGNFRYGQVEDKVTVSGGSIGSEIYEGPFNAQGQLHGYGKIIFADGKTAEGNFHNGDLEKYKPNSQEDQFPQNPRLNADDDLTPDDLTLEEFVKKIEEYRTAYDKYMKKHPVYYSNLPLNSDL